MLLTNTSLQMERNGLVLVFEDIPTYVCANCNADEIPGRIADRIWDLADALADSAHRVKGSPIGVERIHVDFGRKAQRTAA